jgi:GNAT superfamily N-acetyltransferase
VFELRSFCDGDAEAVWRLHNVALEKAGVHGGHGPWENDLRDIRATYLHSDGDFLVGFANGNLVAMGGLLRHSPDEAEIKRMRVHPEFQRQGFGRLLLERLETTSARARLPLDPSRHHRAAAGGPAAIRERRLPRTGRRQTARFLLIDFSKTLNPP